MVLNDCIFDQLLSKEGQKREIERLQNAQPGEVLFVVPLCRNSDIQETLLYKAKVIYNLRIANGQVTFVKYK